jgi:hypothetical protein
MEFFIEIPARQRLAYVEKVLRETPPLDHLLLLVSPTFTSQ